MDIKYFSDSRLEFIRFFYREGRKPFDAVKNAIDNREPPYDVQLPWSLLESGEPPFLTEWLEADMALNVLGYSCVSMLSNSLKITFTNMERQFGFRPGSDKKKKKLFKQGFVEGYKVLLSEILDTDWSDCPTDFAIVEQVVLARNTTQHTDDYSGFDAYHNDKTLEKHPRPFFVGEDSAGSDTTDLMSWFGRRIEVREADLFRAIAEVEKLVDYIMDRESKAHEWRQRRATGT